MPVLYKHKQHGFQIHYTLFFIDGSSKKRYKSSKSKSNAFLIFQDLERFELLASKNRLTPDDIIYFIHKKYITPDEARLLTQERLSIINQDEISLDKLADIYLKHVSTVGSESTRKSYPYKIKPVLEYFKNISPDKITVQIIKEYITERRLSVSKATVNKEIIALRIMTDKLVEIGVFKVNPAREVKIFSDLPQRLPRCLAPEELRTILLSARDYYACYGYFPELIYTYLFTGMRRYELLILKRKEIDFKRGFIKVIGKGDKERAIEIHPMLEKTFQSVILKNNGRKGIYFFGGYDRPFMDENSVGRAFRIFLKRHGLHDNNSLHTLRHTFLTYLLDSGVSVRKVQEIAGHESLKTTMRYLHVVPSKKPVIGQLDYNKYLVDS